ncbi:ubiquinol-cytochrome-c reductase complex assembly factor 1 isoform X1 [Pezoporus wallicus]|uniref:ubiquinol-cytochrome-c reductase complex assembly factor 1 isoform X1 n=1 Tax=Pezoporus wallicus TaxID=35540 RepID=UPI00254DB906|nr:ubiquinol-cytochrome-c reductase complex assembly factor 1 isoform X1 [Pezoporus wallicus]XP_061297881.1 ubiquinol-cytochrome-c reductase complex assembly factor 1 isoform X1 [Pezoporus flaviventris]
MRSRPAEGVAPAEAAGGSMAALVRAVSCQTGVTQWTAACSGLLQAATVQGQCRQMLYSTFQRHRPGQFPLSESCGGLNQANGAITQQSRSFSSTHKHLSAKDSVQTSEEKVGTFTRIIEALGFTGPLKYSRWVKYSKIKVAALRMYTCCVEKTDYEEFFNRCQMPDTLNSWFLVAQLHVWMCLVRMKQEGRTGKYMCRYIVHCMWEDVEQRGKVMGINSVVLKQDMRSMVENFYAALFGYDEGILSDDHVLAAALWRNLFNKNCEDPRHLELLVEYVRKQVQHLDALSGEDLLLTGEVSWRPLVESNARSILKPLSPVYNDEGL